ncbi:MAG TPA: carboxypeptidase regulatory-like domain-containing protein, partial [Planctomycetes bacterium]|nr:carboxypeptidase regulatory-like domain-containing protein [Planctomycetota bacterium]
MKRSIFVLVALCLVGASLHWFNQEAALDPDVLGGGDSGVGLAPASRGVAAQLEENAPVDSAPRSGGHSTDIELTVLGESVGKGVYPIEGAEVRATEITALGAGESLKLRTDAHGRVRIRGLTSQRLTVWASGHLRGALSLEPADGPTKQITLPAMGSLTVRLVGPDGGPLPNAEGALRVNSGFGLEQGDSVVSSAQLELATRAEVTGILTFNALPPGIPIEIVATADGFSRVEQTLEGLNPGEDREWVAVLELRGAMSLTVVDHLDRPVPGAVITAFLRGPRGATAVAKTVTDQLGVAEMTRLKPGNYLFTAAGWNKSGSDLVLLEDLGQVIAGESGSLATLKPRSSPSRLRMQYEEQGVGARTVRMIGSPVTHMQDRPREYYGSYKVDCPMGRPFSLWTSIGGLWSFALIASKVGGRMPDASIQSETLRVELPTDETITFHGHESRRNPYVGSVGFKLPGEPQGSQRRLGFMVLLHEGKVQMADTVQGSSSPTGYAFMCKTLGRHRLIGCLGNQAFDEWFDLEKGVPLQLGLLKSHPAALLTLDALWPDASPM